MVDPLLGAQPLTRDEWLSIYRWGVSPVHLSAGGKATVYQEIGARPVKAGRFRLRPHWRLDDEAETRRFLTVEA